MGHNSLNITMDYREDSSGMKEILAQEYGITVTIAQVKTGDYIINDEIAVERKTALDFVQSIIDGRLFKQAQQMKQSFESCAFIIEGKNPYSSHIDIHPHALKGALISIALAWRIPVLFSENTQDSALLLWLLGTQNIKMCSELSYRPGRRPKRIHKRQLYILQGLPHVGPALALKLLAHFGSVEKVMVASEEELMQVNRLGQLTARKIRKVISG